MAAVAATSPHIAEDAIKFIEVDYEVLPAVLNVRDAMEDDAPILHDNLTMGADDGGRARRYTAGSPGGTGILNPG